MALGKTPGIDDEFASDDGGFSEINITPLTDVILVLLIIFMVTSSIISNPGAGGSNSGVKVNLPSADKADVVSGGDELSVALLSDGRLVLEGDALSSEELEKALTERKTKNPAARLILQADSGVPHGEVVKVMELARKAGLSDLFVAIRANP